MKYLKRPDYTILSEILESAAFTFPFFSHFLPFSFFFSSLFPFLCSSCFLFRSDMRRSGSSDLWTRRRRTCRRSTSARSSATTATWAAASTATTSASTWAPSSTCRTPFSSCWRICPCPGNRSGQFNFAVWHLSGCAWATLRTCRTPFSSCWRICPCHGNRSGQFCSGLWIRIHIGSVFNWACGSGSVFGIRIRIQEGKNYPQK